MDNIKKTNAVKGVLVAIIIILLGGCAILTAKMNNKQEEQSTIKGQTAQKQEKISCEGLLEITNTEKKYFEEYDSENYVFTIKNVSCDKLVKVEFRLDNTDYAVYELHNINPGEEYNVVAYNTLEDEVKLNVVSVKYDNKSIFEKEVEVKSLEIEGSKIKGVISNKGERKLYPNEILFNIKSEGKYIQKGLNYSGCFFEGLVIIPGQDFEFEYDLKSGEELDKEKGIVYKYSDLEFKSYETVELR